MDTKFTELMSAAGVAIDEGLKVKPGEKVTILSDLMVGEFCGLEPLTQAVIAALQERGIDPTIVSCRKRSKRIEAFPPQVEAALLASDAAIIINSLPMFESGLLVKLIGKVRFLLMPNGEEVQKTDKVYRLLPKNKEEFYEIVDLMKNIKPKFLGGAHQVHLTSKNGTDLTLEAGAMLVNFSDGIADQPGVPSCYPGGQCAIGITVGSANGTLVVDGSIASIDRPLRDPITIRIENGSAVSIEGQGEAAVFQANVDKIPFPMESKMLAAEFGLGFNHKAQVTGDLGEDERVYGAAHIGFGTNITLGGTNMPGGWHVDALVLNATVEVDGEVILKDGEYLI